MIEIGLTGGIGSGKSTICTLLDKFADTRTFDCDAAAKKILCSENFRPTAEKILGTKAFANGIPNLQLIADIIFRDPLKRRQLEKDIHFLVLFDISTAKIQAEMDGINIFVVETAILFETGFDQYCDGIICAMCSYDTRIQRLIDYRQMTEEDARMRIATQLQNEKLMQRADLFIYTDCTMDALEKRCMDLHDFLERTNLALK